MKGSEDSCREGHVGALRGGVVESLDGGYGQETGRSAHHYHTQQQLHYTLLHSHWQLRGTGLQVEPAAQGYTHGQDVAFHRIQCNL